MADRLLKIVNRQHSDAWPHFSYARRRKAFNTTEVVADSALTLATLADGLQRVENLEHLIVHGVSPTFCFRPMDALRWESNDVVGYLLPRQVSVYQTSQ